MKKTFLLLAVLLSSTLSQFANAAEILALDCGPKGEIAVYLESGKPVYLTLKSQGIEAGFDILKYDSQTSRLMAGGIVNFDLRLSIQGSLKVGPDGRIFFGIQGIPNEFARILSCRLKAN